MYVRARYFEVDNESPVDPGTRLPYRVEMVGVTCDPGLAVARGIWRQAWLHKTFLFSGPCRCVKGGASQDTTVLPCDMKRVALIASLFTNRCGRSEACRSTHSCARTSCSVRTSRILRASSTAQRSTIQVIQHSGALSDSFAESPGLSTAAGDAEQ
jgi:hypothetical protein